MFLLKTSEVFLQDLKSLEALRSTPTNPIAPGGVVAGSIAPNVFEIARRSESLMLRRKIWNFAAGKYNGFDFIAKSSNCPPPHEPTVVTVSGLRH